MEFPDQGSDRSHSLYLSCSCGNVRSSTQCAGLGIEHVSQRSQDAVNPIAPGEFLICFYLFIFSFLGLHPWHMEVLRLGVESELQLPAYTTATTQDLSRICNLHHSSQQHWILNPLSEARDPTRILMYTSRVHGLITTEPQQNSLIF